MQHLKSLMVIICSASLLFACSSNSSSKDKKNNAAQIPVNDFVPTVNSSMATQANNSPASDTTVRSGDTAAASQNDNRDSMLSQLKGITSLLGKNDSGFTKNMPSGANMESMMDKMQSMMGGKSGNPGDAIGKQLLNLQLGQMSKDNPIKSVANGMMEAQQNGTAGPSKTYTATYTEEQPADYAIPISGDGNTVMLQYTGGSIANGKKDGLWKNIYVNKNAQTQWNVFSEAYAEASSINMKIHATSLASINKDYRINTNDQYKKYTKQPKSDLGKNDFDVQVQKIGAEKMFGYNCIHVKVTYTIKGLGQTAHEQNDEWYSADAPGAQYLSPVIFENHSPVVVKKIMDAGCSGALIKSVTSSGGSTQLIQLSRITQNDMPDSVFTLPSNYQEDKNTSFYGMQ